MLQVLAICLTFYILLKLEALRTKGSNVSSDLTLDVVRSKLSENSELLVKRMFRDARPTGTGSKISEGVYPVYANGKPNHTFIQLVTG